MSGTDLPSSTIPLDGAPHVIALPAYYQAHGLIVVNNGSVALTVSSGRGQQWTVLAAGRLEAPIIAPQPIYTFTSERADPGGGVATATFTQALIPVASDTGTAVQALNDVVLVAPVACGTATNWTLTLTPDMQAVTLYVDQTPATVRLTGNQSELTYLLETASMLAGGEGLYVRRVMVSPALDQTMQLTVNPNATVTVAAVGHRYNPGPTTTQSSAVLVDVLTDNSGALPVALSGPQPALAVSGIVRAAPTYATTGQTSTAGAGVAIAQLSGIAAGTYAVEIDASSPDVAAVNRCLQVIINSTTYATIPLPGGRLVTIAALALSATSGVQVWPLVAGTAGTWYFAAIRLYQL